MAFAQVFRVSSLRRAHVLSIFRSQASLSSQSARRFRQSRQIRDQHAEKGQNTSNSNPTLGGNQKFSFEALGITGWTKWTIIGVVSVLGTMETVFYVNWVWRWWKGDPQRQSNDGE
jgi:hypothetical protein